MHNIWTIAKREYNLYFSSPVAYMMAFVVFPGAGHILFSQSAGCFRPAGLCPRRRNHHGAAGDFVCLDHPGDHDPLLAEERRLGTIELLLTAPVKDWELVVGKWLGGFLLLDTIIALTLIYPLLLNQLVIPGDRPGAAAERLPGLGLAGCLDGGGGRVCFLAVQQPDCSLCDHAGRADLPLVGAQPDCPGDRTAREKPDLISYLDYSGHYFDTLVRGIIDLKDVVFYLSVTALALFLGTVSTEMRRWG